MQRLCSFLVFCGVLFLYAGKSSAMPMEKKKRIEKKIFSTLLKKEKQKNLYFKKTQKKYSRIVILIF